MELMALACLVIIFVRFLLYERDLQHWQAAYHTQKRIIDAQRKLLNERGQP